MTASTMRGWVAERILPRTHQKDNFHGSNPGQDKIALNVIETSYT